MKKAMLPLMLLFIVVIASSVFAASVTTSFSPARASPGEDVTVTLSASGVPVGEVYTIEAEHPAGWNLVRWDVTGYEGDITDVDLRTVENRRGYSFTTSGSSPVVTLTFRVPSSAAAGDYNFDAVYFDSSGQGRSTAVMTVRTIACGDGVCEGSETYDSCASDCPAPAQPSPPSEQQPSEEAPEEGGAGSAVPIVIVAVVVLAVLVFLYIKRKPAEMSATRPKMKK